jgi:S-formylglutathione hydrolase FrmB
MPCACALAVVVAGLAGAASARAASVETWTINSRFVDVAKAQFNAPPPGAPPRSPALRVDVLLPGGYDGVRRFPVLYLLHGHGDAYDSWLNPQRGDLQKIAPGFPGIVVMPEAATGWYTNWWDGGARGTDGRAWESYFSDELVPMVEHRLRLLPGRANRAIAGLSMGGEGAIYLASQMPGYFGSAASFSGVLSMQRPEWPAGFDTQGQKHTDVYGDPTAQQFYWTGHNPTALTSNLRHTRLFVRVGNGTDLPPYPGEETNYFGAIAETELARQAEDFVAAARNDGEDVTFQPTTGIHDWPWWRAALQAALQWHFFAPVAEAPATWRYQTVATSGQAWDVAYRFAQPPQTLETLSRDGDVLSGSGSGTVTVAATGKLPFTVTMPFTRRLQAAPVTRRGSPGCRAGGQGARKPALRHRGNHRRAHRQRVACRAGA